MEQKIQAEADFSTAWVKDNRLVCSGSKTKLLVIGTKELRKSKLENFDRKLSINVAGHRVVESSSGKLLGLIINNTITWTQHLHGNEEHKLSKLMPIDRLRTISNGTFFSLLSYGLQV